MLECLIEELVAHELDSLLERKRAKPQIMYHGTAARHLPKIFQMGMIPNPSGGRWKGEKEYEKTDINRPSMHSLEGSYWTNNLQTAYSAAGDAVRSSEHEDDPYGDDGRMTVIAQIMPQSAKADEDDVRQIIRRAFEASYTKYFGNRSEEAAAPMVLAASQLDQKRYVDMVQEFGKFIHERLKTSDKMPFDPDFFRSVFDAALGRLLGHLDFSEGTPLRNYLEQYEYYLGEELGDYEEARRKVEERYQELSGKGFPEFSKVKGEKEFLQALDKVSSRYRKTAYSPKSDGGSFLNTSLRMTEPIGFSGRNKIIAIIIGHRRFLKLVYGDQVPEQFIKAHAQSWGPNFQIVDRKGNIIHNSIQAEALKHQIESLVSEALRDIDEDFQTRQAMAKDIKRTSPHANLDWPHRVEIWDPDPETVEMMISAGRPIKKVFNKYADRKWLQTLTLVHSCDKLDLDSILDPSSAPNSKDELSARAYEPGKYTGHENNDYGLVLKGHVTLLARDMNDVYTGFGKDYAKHRPERTKSSGANKGVGKVFPADDYAKAEPILILDKEDWDEVMQTYNSEALVDNWKPVAVIVRDGSGFKMNFAKEIVEEYGLDIPVIDVIEARKSGL